jgi:cyclase
MKMMTYVRRALPLAVAAFSISVCADAQTQRDFSKVQIKATKLTDNFYALDGQGGTIGLLVGQDGVFMVDSQYAPLTDKIVAAVKTITNAPIKLMVNTHVHPDHTGGNENLAKLGVIILSRDELRSRLIEGDPLHQQPPAPTLALPLITYDGRVTIHMDGEDVELIPIVHAHTDGDTLVRFAKNNILMPGDFFRSAGYPNIDRGNGGSLSGLLDGLNYMLSLAGPDTKLVPGHGPICTRVEVTAHRDMIIGVRDKVAQLMKQGMSEQDVIAAHPTADYDAKVPRSAESADRFVGQLYEEMKPQIRGQ